MNLLDELRSRIQYKIILPFLLLTLLVALFGSSFALLVVTGDAQDRLANQLAQVARSAGDGIVQVERNNLSLLREMAFAPANPAGDAPAVADALAAGDAAGLARALDPYERVSRERGVRIDRLIVFDRSGRSLLDWERTPQSGARAERAPADLSNLWFVPSILQGRQDDVGDKYAGLLLLEDQTFLYTAAPVVQEGQGVVGGIIAAAQIEPLLSDLARRSQIAVLTLYRPDTGAAFASTAAPLTSLADLGVRPEILARVTSLQTDRRDQGVLDTVRINERDYQIVYAPLVVRDSVIGVVSSGLAADYVLGPWSNARVPLLILTAALTAAIVFVGIAVAGQITRPLRRLVTTAESVIAGDLGRRSGLRGRDEIGVLATSFDSMTGHLLDLVRTTRAEASRRAAIFESIADAIVVTTPDGEVLTANPALLGFLGLPPDAPLPRHLGDIPLRRVDEVVMSFGSSSTNDLFHLGERVVRLSRSSVCGEGGALDGFVFVFQDLTNEVAIDRAKTNFIATISHELRTPLTVITGNVDLLLAGYMGPLADDQRALLETVRHYTRMTTALTNNMITVAKLDSGTMPCEPAPIVLAAALADQLRAFQRGIDAKGLSLSVTIPDDLPQVVADRHMLQLALDQLLDNARRYTDQGGVAVGAALVGDLVRIDISDSGPGIEPALREQLFTRFSRGSDGINSAERGIGLGLAIARELIELQGGRLWLDDSSSLGSTFSLTLPASYAKASVPEPASLDVVPA